MFCEAVKALSERVRKLEGKDVVAQAVTVHSDSVMLEMKAMLDNIPKPTTLTPVNPWQFRFTYMVVMLIQFAYSRGYTVTFGDARTSRDCKGRCSTIRKTVSLHHDGLAVDLNLFKDGKWLQKTEDHRELGEFWENAGGTWGGRFNDGNHYSLEYNGRK